MPIVLLYALAFPVGAATLVVSPAIARSLAVLKISMQIPVLLVGSSDLQVDILRCLFQTYEFWFFTLLNAATCVVFMLHLGDARMVMIPAYWYGIQMNVWSDAKIEARQLAVGAILAALYHVFLLVILGLNLIPEPRPFVLVALGGRSLTSHDFLVNAFMTMLILMMRTAIRKWSLGKKSKDDPNVVSFAPVVNGCAVLIPRLLDWKPSARQRLVLHSIGALGFVGTAFTSVFIYAGREREVRSADNVLLPLSVTSLVMTLAYCGLLFGMYHRQLLKRIFSSFDVLFVLFQVSCAQLALCDLLGWSWRSLTVLSVWIWRLLVTTQDGLMLETRRALHFRRQLTALIVLLDMWVTALVTSTLLRGGLGVLHDRVLLRVYLKVDRSYEVRAATFYLGRAITIMLWSLRLLRRLMTSDEDMLVKITGGVEFDGNPHAARRQRNQRFSLRLLPSSPSSRVEPTAR